MSYSNGLYIISGCSGRQAQRGGNRVCRWDPTDYNANSTAQYVWAMELTAGLDLRGDERALDIGCGDGKITAQIAGRLPNGSALGIDLSSEMIEFARACHPPDEVPNLTFRAMDARDLQFEGEFDHIVSFACLHWIADHRPAIAGMKRSLKPGGRILIQCGGKGNAAGIIEVAHSITAEPEWEPFFQDFRFPYGFYDPDEYAMLLMDAGLLPLRVVLIDKDMTQTGRAGLLGWVRTTWLPYLDRVPDAMRERLAEEITDRYIAERPLDDEGLVHVGMKRLEVEALNP